MDTKLKVCSQLEAVVLECWKSGLSSEIPLQLPSLLLETPFLQTAITEKNNKQENKLTKIEGHTLLTLFLFRVLMPTMSNAPLLTSITRVRVRKSPQLQHKQYLYYILLFIGICSPLQPGEMGQRRDMNFKNLVLALELITIKWKRHIRQITIYYH